MLKNSKKDKNRKKRIPKIDKFYQHFFSLQVALAKGSILRRNLLKDKIRFSHTKLHVLAFVLTGWDKISF